MLLITLLFLAISFTITSYIFKKGVLAFTGATVWMIASIHCFSIAVTTWDTYFSLGFLFVALTIVNSFSPLAWRETTPKGEISEDPDTSDMREEIESWNKERKQYSFLYNNKRPRRKETRYQQTRED